MSLAIETHELTRRFGDFLAVNGIDLQVERHLLRLPRPNGAGKSTTIKMLTACWRHRTEDPRARKTCSTRAKPSRPRAGSASSRKTWRCLIT